MHDVLPLGQVRQPGQVAQPLRVRALLREGRLDLLVGDDPALRRVDEEHLPRREAALLDHPLRGDVEHAGLAAEDDESVAGHPVPAGPQAVAVQDRADEGAVGEGHAGGPVPGLHQAGVEPVERPPGRVHLGVVLPRLGDHHQHGVRQTPAAEVEQL